MLINISVKLFATLSKYTPDSSDQFPVEKGITVKDLVKQLKVPEKDVRLIFVNNKKGLMTSVLNNNDRVGLFPPIGGG
ncbi:MoaD/ThiS family protein [Desulfobacterales bacterium HSG17]|nr:MoaD/ThiS family protein [Desulfobacterales bacterium HSG17]